MLLSLQDKESLNIRPGGHHDTFENAVAAWIVDAGFAVTRATYHEVCPQDVKRLIQRRNTPTALYYRGRADRFAIHKTAAVEFEFEIKTHVNSKYHDLTIELLPAAHHVTKSALGVNCLYIIRDWCNVERGFWVNEFPPIREIHITDRWHGADESWFQEIARKTFSGIPLKTGVKSGGSGDPYIIIDGIIVDYLPDWRSLICAKMAQQS